MKNFRKKTIISWNVNGCRSGLFTQKITPKTELTTINDGNFKVMIDKYNPDVICLQETRCGKELAESIFKCKEYKYKFWNESQGIDARGCNRYSGTTIWCKVKPLNVHFNYLDLNDKEGRFIMIEYKHYCIINVYTPNSGSNFSYRTSVWDRNIKEILDSLDKQVIFCGDLNVVSEVQDIWNPPTLIKGNSPGVYIEERSAFHNYLTKFVDVFRELNPNERQWTWWDMRTKAREKGKGWRIDYFLTQKDKINMVESCTVDNTIMGSDHCPIILKTKVKI